MKWIKVLILFYHLLLQSVRTVRDVLRRVLLVFPQFCLGDGLVSMSYNQLITEVYARFDIDKYQNPFSFDVIGWHMVALGIQGFVFLVITLLLEIKSCRSVR